MRPGRRWRGLLLAAALLLIPWTEAALAQPLPPATAAVIDYQRVMRESLAAQSIRTQVDARRLRYQEEIEADQQRLRNADRELIRQRGILEPDAYAEQRKAFEGEVAQIQRQVQDRLRQLDDVSAMALAEVREAVIQIVGDLAEEQGFNLVLPSAGVLLFSPEIDITDKVLAALDRRLSEVDVPERAPQ